MPLDTYKQQHRGGIGLIGMETKEEDHVTDMFVTLTHNNIMYFTNRGRVYMLKAYRIPVGGRHSKGRPIVNLLPKLEEGEKVGRQAAGEGVRRPALPGLRHQEGHDQEDAARRVQERPLQRHHRGGHERRATSSSTPS